MKKTLCSIMCACFIGSASMALAAAPELNTEAIVESGKVVYGETVKFMGVPHKLSNYDSDAKLDVVLDNVNKTALKLRGELVPLAKLLEYAPNISSKKNVQELRVLLEGGLGPVEAMIGEQHNSVVANSNAVSGLKSDMAAMRTAIDGNSARVDSLWMTDNGVNYISVLVTTEYGSQNMSISDTAGNDLKWSFIAPIGNLGGAQVEDVTKLITVGYNVQNGLYSIYQCHDINAGEPVVTNDAGSTSKILLTPAASKLSKSGVYKILGGGMFNIKKGSIDVLFSSQAQ